MKIGTKSILYGAHCWFLHPAFVAAAWWKLYGFPWDPRLWLAFFVHDLGYFGKPNMDGEEGEQHPEWGARLMHWLFDRPRWIVESRHEDGSPFFTRCNKTWYEFVRYHSRFLAKRDRKPYSLLCVADKLAISLTPAWLYLPMVRATGEIHEYRKMADVSRYSNTQKQESEELWYSAVQDYCRAWAYEHRDGRQDHWTPLPTEVGREMFGREMFGRPLLDEHGTWK